MQMQWGFHRLGEKLDSTRAFAAERQAIRVECAELTRGSSLPALKALTKALATLHRELALADEIAGALKRLAAAMETLGDAPERAGYIKCCPARRFGAARHGNTLILRHYGGSTGRP